MSRALLTPRRRPDSLSIEDLVEGGRLTLRLAGELDLASASMLFDTVLAGSGDSLSAITLDLRDLDFIDASGLHAILGVRALCHERGHVFSLIPGERHVHRVFELTGLDTRLSFADRAYRKRERTCPN